MSQLIIRADHTIRLSAAVPVGEGLWIRNALLTVTATGKTFEAASSPCSDPDVGIEDVLAHVRQMAGIAIGLRR